jgi:hypothetical protein
MISALIVFTGVTSLSSAFADELPAVPVTPAQTKILILPVLDETGDRPDMQKEHTEFGNHRLEYEFITRGFQVIGPDMAIRAARADDIDLDDVDSRTKAAMKQLAKDTGADWVVAGAIVEVHESKSHFDQKRATAKVQMRILDISQDGWIANRFFEDHKDSSLVIGTIGTTGLFRAAIDTTLQRSTSNLLDSYKQTVKVFGEFNQNDYLAGQASAFTGDPKTTFSGLSNNESNPAVPSGSSAPLPSATATAPSK